MNQVCARCGMRAVVRTYVPPCREEHGHDELLCLACGRAGDLPAPPRVTEPNPFTRRQRTGPRERGVEE